MAPFLSYSSRSVAAVVHLPLGRLGHCLVHLLHPRTVDPFAVVGMGNGLLHLLLCFLAGGCRPVGYCCSFLAGCLAVVSVPVVCLGPVVEPISSVLLTERYLPDLPGLAPRRPAPGVPINCSLNVSLLNLDNCFVFRIFYGVHIGVLSLLPRRPHPHRPMPRFRPPSSGYVRGLGLCFSSLLFY